MEKLMEEPIHKPTPKISPYTTPQKLWKFPISHKNSKYKKDELNNLKLKSDFPLASGKRGSGKRISEKVKDYLKAFFIADDIDKTERMLATKMVKALNELVEEGELEADEIPKVNTVESWIARYSHLVYILAAEERQTKSHTSDPIQAEAIKLSKNKHEVTSGRVGTS
ncbi:16963_t:CDS:2, partial [Racocetra fulgida]